MKLLSLLFGLLLAFNVHADEYIEEVYICGDDAIGLRGSSGQWYVMKESDTSEKSIDRMFSMGMAMMAAKFTIGYKNHLDTGAWCGIQDVHFFQ